MSKKQSQKMPLFSDERKIGIVEFVKERKKATVAELTARFNASAATIRNDLRDLQNAGFLTRTHGGAMEKIQMGFEPDSLQKEVHNLHQKKYIAAAALKLIQDGDKVILDTGTTTCELAKLLAEKKDVTVLTNDLKIAGILEHDPVTNIILLGGIVRINFHCTLAIQGKDVLKGLMADKAFMGVNCFSLSRGATTPDIQHAETKISMIKAANKVILLFDSSKIGKISFAEFASLDDIDTIITDHIDPNDKKLLEESGIEVIIAE